MYRNYRVIYLLSLLLSDNLVNSAMSPQTWLTFLNICNANKVCQFTEVEADGDRQTTVQDNASQAIKQQLSATSKYLYNLYARQSFSFHCDTSVNIGPLVTLPSLRRLSYCLDRKVLISQFRHPVIQGCAVRRQTHDCFWLRRFDS